MSALVTIITPTYNKPKHFDECAEAVLAQRFQDWVWWVVFNFGEGEMEQSVRAYNNEANDRIGNDPRILPIFLPVTKWFRENHHVPATIVNWLYPKVQTPFIYFLADDDLIDSDGLGVLVDAIKPENWGHEDCSRCETGLDAAYGRCEVLTEITIPKIGWCPIEGSRMIGSSWYNHVGWLHPGPEVDPCPIPDSGFDIGLGTGIQPDCLIDGGQVLHTKALWDMATADGWKLNDSPLEEHAGHNDGTLLNRLAEFARFHYVPQRIVTHRRTKLSRWHKPV